MAPVDEKIAKARLERKKSMDNPIGSVATSGSSYANTPTVVLGGVAECDTEPYGPPTMAEQAEKNAAYHFEEYNKAHNAAYFLSGHPEFDEFIRLVRSGAIQFLVLALCAAAAFAQKPQLPTPPTPPPAASSPAPTLSTAEKTALQALEKQKQDAQQAFSQAQQAEQVIEREFTQSHPGHHINSLTFTVEADNAPPDKPKAPIPPPKLPTK